jgi:hypothetical protein
MKEVKEANMPKEVASTMINLFEKDIWSWMGMAELFVEHNTVGDIEDFIVCLQMAQEKRVIK